MEAQNFIDTLNPTENRETTTHPQKSVRKATLATLLAQHRDIRCLALLSALITYAPEDGKWFAGPSLNKLGKIIGIHDERTVRLLVEELTASGCVETDVEKFFDNKWTSRRTWLIARSDGKPDFVPMSRKWLYEHASLGASGIGLFLMCETLAGRRRLLRAKVRDLVSMSGLCRTSLDKYMRLIEHCGLIEARPCWPEVEIAMRQNLRLSQNWQSTLSQNLHPTLSQNLRVNPYTESRSNTNSNPNTKSNSESEQDSKHDLHRAKTSADAATQLPDSFVLADQKPDAAILESDPDEPPNHENCPCVDGYLILPGGSMRCQKSLAYEKWQIAAEAGAKHREHSHSVVLDIFAATRLCLNAASALPAPATTAEKVIDGEWHDVTPPSPSSPRKPNNSVRSTRSRTIMPEEMYRNCWARIEVSTGVMKGQWKESTVRRVNGLLQTENVAQAGLEAFTAALREVVHDMHLRERCICGSNCDYEGNCACTCLKCGGFPNINDDEVINIIGQATRLMSEERFTQAPLCATCEMNRTTFAPDDAFFAAVGEDGFYLNCDECDPPSDAGRFPPREWPACDDAPTSNETAEVKCA